MGRAAMVLTTLLLAAAWAGQRPALADDDSDMPAARKLAWTWSLLQRGLGVGAPVAPEELPPDPRLPGSSSALPAWPPGSQLERNLGAGGPVGPTGSLLQRYGSSPDRVLVKSPEGFKAPAQPPVVQPSRPYTATPPTVSPSDASQSKPPTLQPRPGATPGPMTPPQADPPLLNPPTGDLPQGAGESSPARPLQDALPDANAPVSQSPQEPESLRPAPRQTPTPRRRGQTAGDRPGPTIGSSGLPEQASSYGRTLQAPGSRRSIGNYGLPNNRRAYPAAPYGIQPSPTIPYPGRSIGNWSPNTRQAYPAVPYGIQPGPTTPYARRSMGNSYPNGRRAYPAAPYGIQPAPTTAYPRRSMGNLGPMNRTTPGATMPIEPHRRRSIGNLRPVNPTQ